MNLDKFQIKIIESWCKSNGFEIENYGFEDMGVDIFHLNNVSDEFDNQIGNIKNWEDWLSFKRWAISPERAEKFGEFKSLI